MAQNTGPLRRKRAGFCAGMGRAGADATAYFPGRSRSRAIFRSTKEFIKDTFLFSYFVFDLPMDRQASQPDS
jgi:hypothetical protein